MTTKNRAKLAIQCRMASGVCDRREEHWVTLKAANGETLAHSEQYATLAGAKEGVAAWSRAALQVLQDAGYIKPDGFTDLGRETLEHN